MSPDNGTHQEPSGPIAYMAGNSIAANLLMWALIAAGLVSLTGLEREAWPTVPFYHVEVSMPYPGATPEEVEESIIAKIEDQVSGLDDVKAVKSVAAPGMASVRIQMDSRTDMAEALNDIESAVNRIQSFPAGAERPQFREMTNRQSMMRLIVYGDVPERSLKELAYQIEDDLTTLPSVSQVEVSGVRKYETLDRGAAASAESPRTDPPRHRQHDSSQFPGLVRRQSSIPGNPRCGCGPSARTTTNRIFEESRSAQRQ